MSYHSQSPSREPNPVNKKRKRISHECEDLAWTASRCNRLLRSITQRIGALRKLVDNDLTGTVPKPAKSLEKRVASHWSTQDPVWIGDRKAKTAAKTFKGRKKVNRPDSSKDTQKRDGIAFPSPFVRRFGNGGNERETASPTAEFVRPNVPARLTRQLPIQPGSPRGEAETGLLSAFSSALRTTNGKGPTNLRGARSLMSTCLRNVPHYIELNEEDEDDEDVDSSAEVLNYLEELGTKERGGWSGLREVVRSQVVYAVCEAIEDGVLSDRVIQELLEQCSCHDSIPEGEQILSSWIENEDYVTAKQIEALSSFEKDPRSEATSFRIMRTIGDRNFARLAGICRAPRFWNGLLRSLTGAPSYEAAEFLSVCAGSCMEQGAGCLEGLGIAVKETILKLTTMSASAMLLEDSQVDAGRLSCIVYNLAANAIFLDRASQSREIRDMLINCSLLLLGLSQDIHESLSITGLSKVLVSNTSARIRRSDFALDIISNIEALEEHLHVDLTSFLLERMVEQASSCTVPLYEEVALTAISAKRQSSENDENEALYAGYIRRITTKSSSGTAKTPRTPFRKSPKAQFRWEEGICEWVAKTPFTAAVAAPPTPRSISMATPKLQDKVSHTLPAEKSCASVKKEEALPQNSPDVLALSPRKLTVAESPLKPRRAKKIRSAPPVSALPRKEGRRRSSRLSIGTRAGEDSADELGF